MFQASRYIMPQNRSHIGYSLFPGVCSDSIISMENTSVLEKIAENVWEKVLMTQVSNVNACKR